MDIGALGRGVRAPTRSPPAPGGSPASGDRGSLTWGGMAMKQRKAMITRVVAVGAALALLGLGGGGAARADTPSVELPVHDRDSTNLMLLGSSGSEYAARRVAPTELLVGSRGTTLTPEPAGAFLDPLRTVKGIAAWTESSTEDPTSSVRLRRFDLATRASTVTDPSDLPIANTADGWIGYADGTLTRHTLAGESVVLKRGLDEQPSVAADETAALVAYPVFKPNGTVSTHHLDLITLATGSVKRIVTSKTELSQPALSASTLAWFGAPATPSNVRIVNQRPRAGGPITRFTEKNWPQSELEVAGPHVGWVISTTRAGAERWYLRVFTGTKQRAVRLAGPASGIGTAGTRLVTAVGGPIATAGIYSAGSSGAAVREATVSSRPATVFAATLSAGRVSIADNARSDQPGTAIWQRTVSGPTTPALGPDTLLRPRGSASQGISFSAARGVSGIPNAENHFWLLDRGVVKHTLTAGTDDHELVQASGPYTRIAGSIFNSAGKLVLNTAALDPGDFQLYGSLLAYGNLHGVFVRDLARPLSADNPVRLADICPECGPIRIWGTTVAWVSGKLIIVKTIGSSTARAVDGHGVPRSVLLGEGSLTWESTEAGSTNGHTLDLTTISSPVGFLGGLSPVAVDGHWLLSRQTSTGRYRIDRLPSAAVVPSRLIGTVAAKSFSPNGDGTADTWAPAFDTSQPLTNVVLTIRNASGTTVRTLKGTGPDGSIRDLSWNGRTTAGARAAAGPYTWELSATTTDGGTALISVNGTDPISGAVRLIR